MRSRRWSRQAASVDARAPQRAAARRRQAPVAAARLAVTAVLLLLAAGCLDDRAPTAPTARPARLALSARVSSSLASLVNGELVLRFGYARGSLPPGELPSAVITLPANAPPGTTVTEPLELELGPCLADPEHTPAGDSCTLTIAIALRDGARLLDEVVLAPIVLQPGQTATLPSITLFEVATIEITAPPPSTRLFPLGTLALTGRVLDAQGAVVAGRSIAWSSSAAGVATVDAATGLVTAVAPGTTTIRAASGGRTADVELRVLARPVVTVAAAAAFEVERGADAPAALSLPVTNGAEGELTGLAVGTIAFEPAVPGWLSASLAGTTAPTTLTLRPSRTDLPAGVYAATVPLTGTDATAPATVRVTYTVRDPILLLSTDTLTFDAAGALPPARTVAVTTTAGSAGPIATAVTYAGPVTDWLDVTVAGSPTTPTSLSIRPNSADLPSGTHTAEVAVSAPGASGAPPVVRVTYVVAPRLLSLAPATLAFGAAVGAAVPAAQSVAVTSTNGGVGPVTTAITYGPGASGWLTATVTGGALTPTALAVQPATTTLAAGTYTAQVAVAGPGASNTPQLLSVTYTVVPVVLALAPTTLAFDAAGTVPAAQSVAVTSTGASAGPITTSVAYGPGASGWLTVTLAGDGSTPTSLAVQPNTAGLASGTYTATITVNAPNAQNTPQTVAVTYVVAPRVLAVSPGAITFAALADQETLPGAQSVAVTSAGGSVGPVTTSIRYVSGPPADGPLVWLAATVGGPSATPTTVVMRPTTTSATPGTYVAELTVAAAGSTGPQLVTVTYTIVERPLLLSASSIVLTWCGECGGELPQDTVALTSTGGSVGPIVTRIDYPAGGPSNFLSAMVIGSTTTPTRLVIAATSRLGTGAYRATVVLLASNASNSPRTVDVEFQVIVGLTSAGTTAAPDRGGGAPRPSVAERATATHPHEEQP